MPRTARRRTRKNRSKRLFRALGGFGLLLFSVVFCLWTLRFPEKTPSNDSPLAVLSHTAFPEIPAAAAALVQQAPVDQKVDVLTNALWAVDSLARPGVMPYVISALCASNHSLAGVVVGTAVQINDTPLNIILAAALPAAPDQIEAISVAAFRARPASFQETAVVVAEQTGISSTNILRELCEAEPELQPYVDTARLQAEQYAAIPDDSNPTNLCLKQLSEVLPYTMFAITNSGQTLDQALTNNAGAVNPAPQTSTN